MADFVNLLSTTITLGRLVAKFGWCTKDQRRKGGHSLGGRLVQVVAELAQVWHYIAAKRCLTTPYILYILCETCFGSPCLRSLAIEV